ncbi:hypothetical protein [Streptomyces sp. NPDC007905]|uniref:hypothetical protein n=1 Tax=Streptomyces sp. NPDC007905 TaxID=3364788 RepID=UPI0036EAF40B
MTSRRRSDEREGEKMSVEIYDLLPESAPQPPGPRMSRVRRPLRESTKFTDERATTNPEVAIKEQLAGDSRYTAMRVEKAQEFIDDLVLPNEGPIVAPGFRLVPAAAARSLNLDAAADDPADSLDDIVLDQPTTAPAAAVDGNIVATFVDGIRGQNIFDVLDSCLLAQLVANGRCDRESEPVGWTRSYGHVLEKLAWVVPAFDFFGLRSQSGQLSMSAALLKVISGIMTARQVDLVSAAIELMQGLPVDDRRLQIFRSNSVEANAGNFQVDSVGESENGMVSLKLCAFNFRTSENVTDVLWWRFNSQTTLLQATRTTFVLNTHIYDRIRDAVAAKLGNRAQKYIAGLPDFSDEEGGGDH